MSFVSVIIPTRGTDAALLAGCLRALFSQSHLPDEVLVIDNGTGAAEPFPEAFPDCRVLCEPRPGVHHARNRGIVESRGEILVFLDDDVRPEPGWLSALAGSFLDPDVLAAGGPIVADWEEPPPAWILSSSRALGALGLLDLGSERRDLNPEREFLVGGNMACRHAAVAGDEGFKAVWPCRGVGTVAEDYELSRRLARRGRAVYEPRARARHLITSRKTRWNHILRRVYAAEAARASLGGARLNWSRAPGEVLGRRGLVSAAVLLGHLRARLAPSPPEAPS